ncbi:hypothetical protein ES705_43798 [subsurface metagenome]
MISHHASPGRTASNLLLTKHADLLQSKQLPELLEALPYVAAILNFDRQIVFSNKSMLTFLGIEEKTRGGHALYQFKQYGCRMWNL